MADYTGTAVANRDYIVKADDEDQAREFIFDLADEDFPSADTLTVKEIIRLG